MLLSSASIVPRPMPDVAPTKTAVGDCDGIESLAALIAFNVTILSDMLSIVCTMAALLMLMLLSS